METISRLSALIGKKSIAVSLSLWVGVFILFFTYHFWGQAFVAEIYYERSFPFLNKLFEGRDSHTLQFYYAKTDRLLYKAIGLILALSFVPYLYAYLKQPLESPAARPVLRVSAWLAAATQVSKNTLSVLLLLVVAGAVLLPFAYSVGFGERDSFAMAMGVIDSINTAKLFDSEFLYGRRASFAYIGIVYLFSDLIRESPTLVSPVMNYITVSTVIVTVVPLFLLVRRYWGLETAILTNLVLLAIPVWWSTGLYSHPMPVSVFWLLTGLALLSYRSRLAEKAPKRYIFAVYDVLVIAAFTISLACRLDIVLAFALIPACLLLERSPPRELIIRSMLYGLLPLLIVFYLRSQLPASLPSAGFFETLWYWHNPSRFVQNFRAGNEYFLSAFTPALAAIFILSCVYLVFKRDFRSLLFVFPTVLVNYLFWISNPYPARHFIYPAPLIALGVALVLSLLSAWVRNRFSKYTVALVAPLVVLGAFIAFFGLASKIDGVRLYRSPYSEDQSLEAGRLGVDLQALPPQDKTIFVVADAKPVILRMQTLSKNIQLIEKSDRLMRVANEKNQFLFYTQGWRHDEIVEWFHGTDAYDGLNWIIDPYNRNIILDETQLGRSVGLLDISS